MKKPSNKQTTKQTKKTGSARLGDIRPTKDPKGGTLDSRPGVGILKSTDGGKTWT